MRALPATAGTALRDGDALLEHLVAAGGDTGDRARGGHRRLDADAVMGRPSQPPRRDVMLSRSGRDTLGTSHCALRSVVFVMWLSESRIDTTPA